jgi:hypothetical protein
VPDHSGNRSAAAARLRGAHSPSDAGRCAA